MAQPEGSIWIPARDLKIANGDDPNHWTWEYDQAVSQDVATLVSDTTLSVVGVPDPATLPPHSAAAFLFKLKNSENIDEVYGYYGPSGTDNKGQSISLVTDASELTGDWFKGWHQVNLGTHSKDPNAGVGVGVGEPVASVTGVDDGGKPKSGLIVAGILVHPIIAN